MLTEKLILMCGIFFKRRRQPHHSQLQEETILFLQGESEESTKRHGEDSITAGYSRQAAEEYRGNGFNVSDKVFVRSDEKNFCCRGRGQLSNR